MEGPGQLLVGNWRFGVQLRTRRVSHLVARRTFFLPRASPPKILGIVRGLLTNIKSRNLHSIASNY
jgi:hypothetical protein